MGAVVRVAEIRGQGGSAGMGGGHEGQQSGADGLGAGVCVQGQGWQGTAMCLLCWAQWNCIPVLPCMGTWWPGQCSSGAGEHQAVPRPCSPPAPPILFG